MSQHIRDIKFCYSLQHIIIPLKGRDIIDYGYVMFPHDFARNLTAEGIYRHYRIGQFFIKQREHGMKPFEFLLLRYRFTARTCGTGSNIKDCGTIGNHPLCAHNELLTRHS